MSESLKSKPILKRDRGSTQQSCPNPLNQSRSSSTSLPSTMASCDKDVPLMFQAQIEGRGNIQYVGEKKDKRTGKKSNEIPKYEQWVNQWLKACPPVILTQINPSPSSMDGWQKALEKLTTVKKKTSTKSVNSRASQQWEYQVSWRLVTNSGQDNFIRPVIGKEGMPFFPGSSMKGAFRKACSTSEERMRYCGSERKEDPIKPGILRFHGGYPVDDEWKRQRNRLVDIVHNQEEYQVRDGEAKHNANIQISLYQIRFKFDISTTTPLSTQEWSEVERIWERALGYGLGSRISAGYGYMEKISVSYPVLKSVYLKGQGLSSVLLLPTRSRTDEFRPNMFKAALRSHTWRLLAGVTDEATAQKLTHQLWGGISKGAVEGAIGINFVSGKPLTEEYKYKDTRRDKNTGNLYTVEVSMPTYDLEKGQLDLFHTKEIKPELEKFLYNLLKFSMLLGGFGKSWRRVHHALFYKSYFKNNDKPMIGCHWDFLDQSKDLYIQIIQDDLSEISNFLEEIRQQTIEWIQSEDQPLNDYVSSWREAWHPHKVQVWGRFAQAKQSKAVEWFHNPKYLKDSNLAGSMGQIGRIWHRMYPIDNNFIELLTIFPDNSNQTVDFLTFLDSNNSGFSKLWGGE